MRSSRRLPARLTARVTLAIVLTAAVVFALTTAIVGVALSVYTRSLARIDSQGHLTEVRNHLDLQALEMNALVLGFTDWREFYEQTLNPDAAFIAREFDPWLADRASASTVVWASADGTIIASLGDRADVEVLLGLGRGNPDGASGPVSLPSGPATVAVRPIIGDPPTASVGTLAVARAISAEDFAANGLRSVAIISEDMLSVDSRGWREIDTPSGYSFAATRVTGGHFLTRASLVGIDRRSALALELSRPDPWLGEGRGWFVFFVPLGLGLATLGIAYLLGTNLGRSIGRPLQQFVTYLQDQGYLALQGLRTDEELLIDQTLPADFATLGQVITDLMTQLRINQSDLIEAGEQALAAERAFRTVVEESPEVKILVRDGVVEIANPAAAHFFGLQLGDLLRAEPDGLFSGIQLYDEDEAVLEIMHLAQQAHDAPVVARCAVPDQPDRWIELSVAFIDETGNDYVISARNVTEERRLEALREEVISLVSHDLRSPLTVVRGYLDILDRPLDEQRREAAVESSRRAAIRMEDLLDDLLHATRAERVFAPKVMRPIDLAALIEGIAASLQMSAEQTIVTSLDPGVTVLGDPVRLEQAVTNLIGNAIKHGPPDGEVRIGVETRDGRAIVSIEDEGPGIPADQREAVFERGVRGSASQATPGLGLGLYIVRVVAEAHGGQAFVDESASGTRFVLDLPLMQTEPDGL